MVNLQRSVSEEGFKGRSIKLKDSVILQKREEEEE